MGAEILWRRLDVPGHDACRLIARESGWRIEGSAVSLQDGAVASLRYKVESDAAWRPHKGSVKGWFGDRTIDFKVTRVQDAWELNGEPITGLSDCIDLDYAFTPATNLLQIKRIALDIGAKAGVCVAWFNPFSGKLERLEQVYERRGGNVYWYEAPRFAYRAILSLHPAGFVEKYPDFWEVERNPVA